MPWRGAEEPDEFPTLGYQVAEWIEAVCPVPDGDRIGEPLTLTDEQLRFLLHFYRVDPSSGRFTHQRGGQLVRPQKWGKGPFSSAVVLAEGAGPVLFAGWDAAGEPVGRPWSTPWIQVTAASEDQTDNVWRSLQPMAELGALAADLDTGLTRINLPGGGIIEPVTSAAGSRLGQKITFALQDETHDWLPHTGGRKLADTQRRNVAGMGGRWLETTNAWDPAERSVAQTTNEHPVGVHIDYPKPPPGSVRNKRERRKVMRSVYGDSLVERDGWVDLDRIDIEVQALLDMGDAPQAERYFLNRCDAGASAAFDPDRWRDLQAKLGTAAKTGGLVVCGVDGARFDDAVAAVATEVETGLQWPVGIWERPEHADDDYEHPLDDVDQAMVELHDVFDVWRTYVDPQWIEHLLERWQGRWTPKRVLPWFTNRPRQVGYAMRNYAAAISAGDVSHNGDPTLATHLANARRKRLNVRDEDGRWLWTIQKERADSPRKIDAAMAAMVSWEARGDCIAAGSPRAKKRSKRLRTF